MASKHLPIGTYQYANEQAGARKLVNCTAEQATPDSGNQIVLRRMPGIDDFTTAGSNIRGRIVFNGVLYVVSGTSLFKVELGLSAAGAGAVVLIQLAHSVQLFLSPTAGGPSLFVFFGVSLVMTLLVGLLSGVELPLLIQIGNDVAPAGKLTNRVLGWDYIGALVAGVLFPLALVPFVSLPVIGFVTAAANLSVATYVLRRFVPRDSWVLERIVATAALGVLLLVGVSQGSAIQQYFLKRYYFHFQAAERGLPFSALDDLPNVTRAYSPYQKIDLVYDPSGFPTDMLRTLPFGPDRDLDAIQANLKQ